ncbi:hypothetical protein ACSTD8_21495 [Vibrio vulnificus]|uniref:hypothetical protein n=1 Tax=Vibrio vulnificus TaxID=672 RepID=UPI003ED90ED0
MIYTFLKIFDKKEYAEQFLKGELYMQTLRDFKDWKDENGELRGDPLEGITAYFQPDSVDIILGGKKINPKEISSPIVIHNDSLLGRNAFCLYSLNSDGFKTVTNENKLQFKNILSIHKDCYGLGGYCVCVLKPHDFTNKIAQKLDTTNFNYTADLVKYFDERSFNGELDSKYHGLQKRSSYSHQHEFRLLVDRKVSTPSSFTLSIGNISKYCTEILTPDEFNDILKIQLPHGEVV